MTDSSSPSPFVRVEGPGRCSACSYHVATQGHHPQCPGGVVTQHESCDSPPDSTTAIMPWYSDEYVAEINREHRAEFERRVLGASHSYMHNAHLLPPREAYGSVDKYVRLLKTFERIPADEVIFIRPKPTLPQRRDNAAAVAEWVAAQSNARGPDNRYKRAIGLVNWWCFTGRPGGGLPLAQLQPNTCRDSRTNDALRNLAPLVNDGTLSRDELADPIIDASHRSGHIPENKSRQAVEYAIDRAIGKFTEAFDWERLDDAR